jgi:6-pyruvoyltetrahydropterin/6-carboxytetrahydropterin synthase
MYGEIVTGATVLSKVRQLLQPQLPNEVALTALRLESTPLYVDEWAATQPGGSANAFAANISVMTRIYEFSASHRLHSKYLSDDENRALFGKCNFPNGHGHNYIVEVSVAGTPDRATGRILSTDKLDEIVNCEVVDRYDHRHLNLDIPEFFDVIPSSEILTLTIWNRLVDLIPSPARLYRVLVRETARNYFEYYGKD